MPELVERWAALPSWARWALAYAGIVLVCVGVGAWTPVGIGNMLFFAGIGAFAGSLVFIRLGGPRTLVARSQKGEPIWSLDPDKRKAEIRRGWRFFFLGLALWAPLPVMAMLGL